MSRDYTLRDMNWLIISKFTFLHTVCTVVTTQYNNGWTLNKIAISNKMFVVFTIEYQEN